MKHDLKSVAEFMGEWREVTSVTFTPKTPLTLGELAKRLEGIETDVKVELRDE